MTVYLLDDLVVCDGCGADIDIREYAVEGWREVGVWPSAVTNLIDLCPDCLNDPLRQAGR